MAPANSADGDDEDGDGEHGDRKDGDPGVGAAGEAGHGFDEGRPGGERDAGPGGGGPRDGGTEARTTVLAMLQSGSAPGLPLTGREVSDRVGCHVGEGRKVLREARLQHLQGRLADAARRGAEVTAEDVMAPYQARVDHAARLLTDARHAAAPGGAVAAASADDPSRRDGEDGGTRRRLVAAS